MSGADHEVITAWRAVADAAKILPALAGYEPVAVDPDRTCATCGYHDGGDCFLVAGHTDDEGACRLWRHRPRHARPS